MVNMYGFKPVRPQKKMRRCDRQALHEPTSDSAWLMSGAGAGGWARPSPDDVALQDAILVVLWGRLPLDHDGLVCAAAGNDRLGGCAGGLLRER